MGREGFNEAAGIPRGRPQIAERIGGELQSASMRPRVFPAEDAGRHRGCCAPPAASMRPRVFPAEDLRMFG